MSNELLSNDNKIKWLKYLTKIIGIHFKLQCDKNHESIFIDI